MKEGKKVFNIDSQDKMKFTNFHEDNLMVNGGDNVVEGGKW